MSALPAGRLLDDLRGGLPPKETRILAPSLVDVENTGGYSTNCVCSLRITDTVNLTLYYVPCTAQMVRTVVHDLMRAAGIDTVSLNAEDHDR